MWTILYGTSINIRIHKIVSVFSNIIEIQHLITSGIPIIFRRSSTMVSNYCNGVDLNCGCPQTWAQQEGIGACLINKPQFVSDLVKQTRNQCRDDLSVAVKIRIHADIDR